MPKHHDHHHGGRSGLFGLGLGALSFGAVASAVAGTHKIIETAVQLRNLWDVGEDNMVFVRIMERVKLDLREVERLLGVPGVKQAVRQMEREKVKWIEETMRSVRVALDKTAEFTKRVKKDTDRGVWVGLRNRIWFRMEEFEKLELHTLEIARCHDGLLQVLGLLSGLESGRARSSSHSTVYDEVDEKESGGRRYESVGYGQTIRDERREIDYRLPRDDFWEEGDIVYTRPGDGPGYSAEIAVDRFDGQQLEAQFAGRRDFSGDRESRDRHGEHITQVEVDRVVERDDGERVASHYVEKHADDHAQDRHHHGHWRHVHKHYHHDHDGGSGDERHIDVKRRAEVRRHHGSDHVTKVEIDGYETRDDGHRVEAHYTEEREDDRRRSGSKKHRHHGEEERYIDLDRRAEIRRRD